MLSLPWACRAGNVGRALRPAGVGEPKGFALREVTPPASANPKGSPYSVRSASIGSIRAARRAGR
jgi:hypothetical protein